MRICRFDDNRLGLVEGDSIKDVTAAAESLPSLRWPAPSGDHFMNHFAEMREAIGRLATDAPATPASEAKLLSPMANPGKIIAAPVNYEKHLAESRADTGINFGQDIKTISDYGVFLKAPSALVGPGEGVVVDWADRRTDHEVELALVIGRRGFRIPESEALSHVAGYMIGLDMTIRGTEDRSFRKSLDTFAVLGPWLVTADEIADPGALDFELRVNGEVRQQSNTRHLIFDVPQLIHYASQAYTLHPGDVIMTGTPEGVAPVAPGDVMQASIDGIGAMDVPVRGAYGTV